MRASSPQKINTCITLKSVSHGRFRESSLHSQRTDTLSRNTASLVLHKKRQANLGIARTWLLVKQLHDTVTDYSDADPDTNTDTRTDSEKGKFQRPSLALLNYQIIDRRLERIRNTFFRSKNPLTGPLLLIGFGDSEDLAA